MLWYVDIENLNPNFEQYEHEIQWIRVKAKYDGFPDDKKMESWHKMRD